MEFKCRAVDKRPSEHYPHSPSLSFGSQQAIGADFTSHTGMKYAPDVGSSLSKNVEVHRMQKQVDHYLGAMDSDPRYNLNCTSSLGVYPKSEWNSSLEGIKYDAIQRQLEKQRIREEIIASEIMRRRILQTEVRRELEQEMALRRAAYGFHSQERFPFLFDQRFSFVDRLNNELMQEPQALGGHSTVNLFSLRYPLRPFSEATQPGINSEASGSREIIQAKQTPDLSESKRKLISTPSEQCTQEPPIRNKKLKKEHSFAFWPVSTTSAKSLNEHVQGKRHILMEEKLIAEKMEREKSLNSEDLKGEATAGSGEGTGEETDQKSIQLSLEALKDCDETSPRKDDGPNIDLSMEKSVQQPVEDLKVCNSNCSRKDDGSRVIPKVEICLDESNDKRKKKFKFWCEPCGVGAFSETVFESHKKGKKHWLHVRFKEEAKSDNAVTAAKSSSNSGPLKVCSGNSRRKDDGPNIVPKVEICPESNINRNKGFKFWCEPCEVGAFSEMVLKAHKEGKKHWLHVGCKEEATSDSAVIAAENNSMSGPPQEGLKVRNSNSSNRDDGSVIVQEVEVFPDSNNKRKKSFKFWCQPCAVGAFSEKVFEAHKKSKKHQVHVGFKEEATSDGAVAVAENNNKSGPLPGNLNGCNGSNPRKDDEPKAVLKVEICPEESNYKRKKSFKFWCEPCGVGAFSETVFEAHKKGKKHWLHVRFEEEATLDNAFTAAENNSKSGPPPEVN